MELIIKEENMAMDDTCKEYLVSNCSNSVRIMVNYLEKLYILNKPTITPEFTAIIILAFVDKDAISLTVKLSSIVHNISLFTFVVVNMLK